MEVGYEVRDAQPAKGRPPVGGGGKGGASRMAARIPTPSPALKLKVVLREPKKF